MIAPASANPVRLAKGLGCVVAAAVLAAAPASAGQWINGGAFDAERGVGVNFLRFLAGDDEGQMTIRCDREQGLWIDVGVLGNAELPPGTVAGDRVEATLDFTAGDSVTTIVVAGALVIRGDGAVVVSVAGDDVREAGLLLLQPADRLDVTIAGITRPLSMDGIAERARALADWCGMWPQSMTPSLAAG